MAKRCVYLSSDAEWVIARVQRLAEQYDVQGLSRSVIIMAGLDALNDGLEADIIQHLKDARDARWDKCPL